ncbi:MAG: CPBP family intramembrane glutamic endopeptidase [Croceibacterium sp.]
MTAAATSPQHASLRDGVWAQFFAFVRRPTLPDRATGMCAEAWPVLGKLLALDVLVMFVLAGTLAAVTRLGFVPPHSLLEQIKPSALVLAALALGAPVAEELLFRSWQSGRAGHIGALLIALGALALAGVTLGAGHSVPRAAGAAAVLLVGLGSALWWLRRGRAKPAMGWFQRHYAPFYFAATGLFALAHMTNFTGAMAWTLVPLTLPQFSIGLMLGYVRVRFGLWSSMLLHATHNGLFMLLLVAGVG